jgi:hypothetical protein
MDRSLDGHSIFALIVFGLVGASAWELCRVCALQRSAVVCVNHAFRIPLPRRVASLLWAALRALRLVDPTAGGSMHVHLSLVWTPLLGVLILLITMSIDGTVVRYGIAGEEGVRPYDVLVLFISLAFIATALDATGALRYLAFTVSQKGNGSGARLYASFWAFFFGASVLVGNDPIVLSGTAFLAYFTRVTGIVPPTAWIFAQFLTANCASAVLVCTPISLLSKRANALTGV